MQHTENHGKGAPERFELEEDDPRIRHIVLPGDLVWNEDHLKEGDK